VALESVADVAEERVGKDAFYTLDSQKIRRELGWSDTLSLDAGIDETLAWVDANLDDLKRLPQSYIHKP
jgi:dTDP-glucose 4,6-dehydratase